MSAGDILAVVLSPLAVIIVGIIGWKLREWNGDIIDMKKSVNELKVSVAVLTQAQTQQLNATGKITDEVEELGDVTNELQFATARMHDRMKAFDRWRDAHDADHEMIRLGESK